MIDLPASAFSTPSDFGSGDGDMSKGEFTTHRESSLQPDKVY